MMRVTSIVRLIVVESFKKVIMRTVVNNANEGKRGGKMRREIHKCASCHRIIGVIMETLSKKEDVVVSKMECVNCYNQVNWGNRKDGV